MDAGLVLTMKSIISTANQENYFVLAVRYGIDALTQLSETGTLDQKRALAKHILEHDILTVVYDVRKTSRFILSADPNFVP